MNTRKTFLGSLAVVGVLAALAAPAPQTEPTTQPAPVVTTADRSAPRLTLALKATTSRKLRLTTTLGERANLTITAKSRSRTLLKTVRNGVAAGKPTFTLSLKRDVRRGQKVTVTVQARDAAGNVTTRTISAKTW